MLARMASTWDPMAWMAWAQPRVIQLLIFIASRTTSSVGVATNAATVLYRLMGLVIAAPVKRAITGEGAEVG